MQFPTKLILHSSVDIYMTDIDNNLKIVPLNIKKWFEKEDESIVQITNSLHLEFCIYAITNRGNLYFIYLDMKDVKPTKVEKY